MVPTNPRGRHHQRPKATWVGSPFYKIREELSTGAYRRGAFHRITWHIGLCGGDPGVEGGWANKRFRTWEPGVEEMPLHGDNGRKTLRVLPYLDDDLPVVVQLDADNCGEMAGSKEHTDGPGAQLTEAPRLQPTIVHGRRLIVGHFASFALRTPLALFWATGCDMMTAVAPFSIPQNLLDAAESEPRIRVWLEALPVAVDELAKRWSLQLGEPFQPGGQTAWVAPARSAANGDVVLKIAWRHAESTHEADGLREWNGDGVVRLYASEDFDDTVALLLERCVPGLVLASRPESEQDRVVAGLLHRLWREPTAGHSFRPLQLMCEAWAREFEQKAAAGRTTIDPGLAREGIALLRGLPATADRNVLLCTDLHAENVLSAEREPSLVIDPKPYVGDPTYDPLQHPRNCDERLQADPVNLVRGMADLLGLDAQRLLLWLFARCVQQSPEWPQLIGVARRIAPS